MAVSINKVYQKVLALTNKEQRGYITPQEFNLFADHAQMDIFEQYFYDLEQRQRGAGNNLDYADIADNIQEKIDLFKIVNAQLGVDGSGNVVFSGLGNFYRLGLVTASYNATPGIVVAEQVSHEEYVFNVNSPLASPSSKFPVYVMSMSNEQGKSKIQVFPPPIDVGEYVSINYIAKPAPPKWTYFIDPNTKSAMFAPVPDAGWHDFELHPSEENTLVIKILQLAGIAIKDFNLTQVAAQEEVKNIQQEKQ